MKIVAGLGNPGSRYARTRHNAGWMALDRLARRCASTAASTRAEGELARCEGMWLFRPLSFMNRSGPPIARALREKNLTPQDLLVLVDDVNLSLGSLRLRAGGSAGGHNGLSSIIGALDTEQFPRLRLGVGPCPPRWDLRDFVLSRFRPAEEDAVEEMTDLAARAALCWREDGVRTAMSRFNRTVENEANS